MRNLLLCALLAGLALAAPPALPDPLRPEALDFLEEGAAPLMREAQRLREAGEHRRTAALLLQLLERHPRELRFHLALAECYAHLRQPALWARSVEAAVRAGQEDLEGLRQSAVFRKLAEAPEYARIQAWLAEQIRHRGERRHAEMTQPLVFRFHSPRQVPADWPLPLVVALHGAGGTAEGFAPIWALCTQPAFRMAVPEAPYPMLEAEHATRPSFNWAHPTQDRALWDRTEPQIAAYLRSVVAEVRKTHAVSDVYLLGHSQGGTFACLAAFSHPGAFKGVITLGSRLGGLVRRPQLLAAAAGKVPLLLVHGREDDVVPFAPSQETAVAFRKAGLAVTWHPTSGGHGVTPEMIQIAQRWIEAGGAEAPAG